MLRTFLTGPRHSLDSMTLNMRVLLSHWKPALMEEV